MHQNDFLPARTFIQSLASSSAVKNTNFELDNQSVPNADRQSIETNQRTGNEPLNGAPKSLSGAKIGRSFIQPAHNFPLLDKSYANNNNSEPTICDKQLNKYDVIVKPLIDKCIEKDIQLAENKKTIKELQTECSNKNEQLNEKATFVKRLEEDCEEKDRQLIERGNTIRDLQEKSNNKDKSIFNGGNILKAIFLCFFVALIVALAVLADRRFGQRQHIESTEESNSLLKQSTVNELNALSNSLQLFDQEEIDATNSTLISDQKYILLYRAKAYFELGDYSDAYQHLEVALRLDPNYEEAQNLLTVVQEHIDRVN